MSEQATTTKQSTASKYEGRGWPNYILRGRVRTSTASLVVAFVALFWVNQTFGPSASQSPEQQVVPPGFLPDPNYTWVPRTNVREQPRTPTTTTTRTYPTTPTTTSAPSQVTTTSPLSPTSTTSGPSTPSPSSASTSTSSSSTPLPFGLPPLPALPK